MEQLEEEQFVNKGEISGLSAAIASRIESTTQFQKYHNLKTGHGFAAEDVNALNDILHLRNVQKVGLSNAKDGADRIVDGVQIQVKYFKTATDSVNAAFRDNRYRYGGHVIEVPKDQYLEAVEKMKDKIRLGQVYDKSGKQITDIDKAKDIVKEGSVTYQQAQNIAKAGNIDSLLFDVKNQSITSSCVLGLSFAISYACNVWNGDSHEKALKKSIYTAVQTGAGALIIGVVTSQLLRTTTVAAGVMYTRAAVNAVAKSELGKQAILSLAEMSLGQSVKIAAAKNYVAKLLRGNVVTAVVATAVTSAPDLYRAAIAKNISWGQFAKNLGINAAGVVGGTGGWVAGAAAGASLGSVVPGVGTAVGGFIGGLAGAMGAGMAASKAAKMVGDLICEDDAVQMLKMLQEESATVACDYLLSEKEIKIYIETIQSKATPAWLRDMYACGETDAARKKFANDMLSQICEDIIRKREKITLDNDASLLETAAIEIKNIIDGNAPDFIKDTKEKEKPTV